MPKLILTFNFVVIIVGSVFSQEDSECYQKSQPPCVCPGNCENPPIRVCYYNSDAFTRSGKGKCTPEDLKDAPCTHVVLSFLLYDDQKQTVVLSNQEVVVTEVREALRSDNKLLMVALGGWNDSTVKYSTMMANVELRGKIVTAITEFLVENDLDGLDCDIEYPAAYQGKDDPHLKKDKDNFVLFLQELRYAFANLSRRLILSVAVSANEKIIDIAYDVPRITEVCDWLGVMAYDFHGKWEPCTGHVAPFSVQPGDQGAALKLNVQSAMQLWLDRKAPACKLVVGIPCYGQAFRLEDCNKNGWRAPAEGDPDSGLYTNNSGTLAFYEIIEIVKRQNWKVVHNNCIGTYAHFNLQWIGYDDLLDVAEKASYTKDNGFRGTMFWSLDNDCYQQDCPAGRYPVILTVTNILTGNKTLAEVTNLT